MSQNSVGKLKVTLNLPLG